MFALKQIINKARMIRPGFRALSSSNPLVDTVVDNEGIATVTMQRPPVNSLNLDMLQSLISALDEVNQIKCKGMILTSSSPTVFSAGLDIMEIYKPDMKRVETFWTALQEAWIKLFGSNVVTAAAINGHAPAGACLLAMSCEYRVMVSGKYTIGLSEANLGIVVYKWIIDTMSNTISQRDTELAISTGRLFSVDEALKVGLIDEIATNKPDAIEKCKQFIKKFDNIPPLARAITKQKIREAPLTWMKNNRTQDTQDFLKNITNPKVQQALEMYIQKMKQRNEAAQKDK